MDGTRIEIDLRQLRAFQIHLDRLSDPRSLGAMGEVVGALVENQTRTRIQEGKHAPDGTPWEPWSDRYARTRHGNHSLLMDTAALRDSITHNVTDLFDVEVGSNLIYGPTHQFGDEFRNIPERPFLGLSEANTSELHAVVLEHLDEIIRGET